MANVLARFRRRKPDPLRDLTLEDYISLLNQFTYQGNTYPFSGLQPTMTSEKAESIGNNFDVYGAAYKTNGIIFACMLARMAVFSSVRFQFQQLRNGRPGKLFGTQDLEILETPWAGGTTQDYLARKIQDADLAGNAYTIKDTPLSRLGGDDQAELIRLRPDYLDIVLAPRIIKRGRKDAREVQVGYKRVGYFYWEDGDRGGGKDPAEFLTSEVAHFAPIPDPQANFRGMSWLTPVVREVENDNLMMRHKRKFFENAATPNVIVRMDPMIKLEAFLKFKAEMENEHRGVDDAYKTLYVGGAQDVTLAGSNFHEMDFKTVQGAGETRIAAAAGVHPVIVGLSEGMQGSALNAGNYGQVRKRFANGTMHPLWQNAAGSLRPLVAPPRDARLWYDARDVPFLQEDEKIAAEIEKSKASTITMYVREGFTAESAVDAVDGEDITLLEHTGFVSVQLQVPGEAQAPADEPAADDTDQADDQEGQQDDDSTD